MYIQIDIFIYSTVKFFNIFLVEHFYICPYFLYIIIISCDMIVTDIYRVVLIGSVLLQTLIDLFYFDIIEQMLNQFFSV